MIALLLRMIAWLFAVLPMSVSLWLGRNLGTLFGMFSGSKRARTMENLTRCLPELKPVEHRAIMWRMFSNLGMNAAEMLSWLGGRNVELESRIRTENEDIVKDALQRGKGVAILTAHLGNWDLMGLWSASHYPMNIVSKAMKNEALNRFWMEKRAAAKVKIIPAHNSFRRCLRVLKENELLGFILDQNIGRKDGIFVNFFGKSACTTPGLAMLAAQSQAPVVPVFMIREAGGKHCVKVFPAIAPPKDREPETLAAATQEYTKVIEDVIRAHPDQWIWMHRRWRTRPMEEEMANGKEA